MRKLMALGDKAKVRTLGGGCQDKGNVGRKALEGGVLGGEGVTGDSAIVCKLMVLGDKAKVRRGETGGGPEGGRVRGGGG